MPAKSRLNSRRVLWGNYGEEPDGTTKKLLSSNKKIIEITLKTAVVNTNMFQATVEPGAVKDASATSKLTNFQDATSAELTISGVSAS